MDASELAEVLPKAERQLHTTVIKFARSLFVEIMSRLDVDVPGVVVDGERYVRRNGKTPGTYFTLFGKVKVLRTTDRKRACRGSASVVPLDLRAGLVANSWTLEAAKVASSFLAVAPAQQASDLLAQASGLAPSKTHLDRLPKEFNELWEADRERWEAALRASREARSEVAVILLSKDGIMVSMKDAPRETDPNKADTGPKGHQEVGCATLSLFDRNGKRLETYAAARMPESGKISIGEWLEQEARWAIQKYPHAQAVAVADGAKDNWSYFEGLEERLGVRLDMVLDFFHAMEHIATAFRRFRGRDQSKARDEIAVYRKILRDEPGGLRRVVQALEYRAKRSKGAVKEDIEKELAYLRNNADRMLYHRFRKKKRPIGSGVQEAACKTLVAQRLKLSGMSWRHTGGQGVLTLRAVQRSGQLCEAWDLLQPALVRPFTVDLSSRRARFCGSA